MSAGSAGGRTGALLGALVHLDHPARYIHWGWFIISLANLIVIPRCSRCSSSHSSCRSRGGGGMSAEPGEPMWTGRLRDGRRALPPERLLPDRQPVYVASWIYVFGVATIAALRSSLASGACSHFRAAVVPRARRSDRFVNGLHLWSVELFFFFMVIHLWGKFFMAAWRGKRTMTWITGACRVPASIGTAFTGYLSNPTSTLSGSPPRPRTA